MTSYRTSHVGSRRGEQYDAAHAGKVDSHIWDTFIKGFLCQQFAASVAGGATRYLDFACGTGRVLKLGSKYFPAPLGIDISEDMLAVARERVPDATILCGDVTSGEEFAISQFDCVTLFRFLLNAERPLSMDVLHWLSEHMPSGSRLIGNNHMNLASFRGILTATSNTLRGTKHNYLSRRSTTKMLEESGFRIVRWSGYRVLPTIKGKPIFGKTVQLGLEKIARRLSLGRFGSEQIFVAEKV